MKSALVIGGGMAGLAAARELARHGVHATVLEAKSRWGGRIHTLPGRAPIELGAEFVHGRNPRLLQLISEAGLVPRKAPDGTEVFENGSRHKVDFWEKVDAVLGRIKPLQPDRPFESILTAAETDARAERWARGYVEGFNAADSRRISAHSILRLSYSAGKMDGSWQARLDQGYDTLVRFLVRQVETAGVRLLLDTSVGRIDWRPGKVEVSATQDGRLAKFEADAAILTLPLGVWKAGTVALHPSIPGKMQAIEQLIFGNVVKLILEFRERWWDPPAGFLHAYDQPLPTWWQNSETMLTAWAGGPKADALLALSKEELLSQALATLGLVMSEKPEVLREKLVRCHYKNWAADPEIRGAYSYIPVNGLELPKLLAEPVQETLFFAGEATIYDAQTGTTFGALESGVRAAGELVAGLCLEPVVK